MVDYVWKIKPFRLQKTVHFRKLNWIYSKLAESIKCKGDLLVTYEFISCKIVPRETLK